MPVVDLQGRGASGRAPLPQEAHRSFLVNLRHARAFQRKDDKAFLVVPALKEEMVPVSRFHVAEVRRALGI